VRPRYVVTVIVALVVALVWAWTIRSHHAFQRTVMEQLRIPDGAEAIYPRLGSNLRSRCWMLSGPFQPEGMALFVRLPDIEFGPMRIIHARELRPSLDLIVGRSWDAERAGWIASDGSVVSQDRLRESLEAACPTPADARLIIDLLLGQPAPATVSLQARLKRGELPERMSIQPFKGTRGLLLRDIGRPPYKESERSYEGCLLAFSGADWPGEWRLGRLSAVGY
jgi:hypothetical protein